MSGQFMHKPFTFLPPAQDCQIEPDPVWRRDLSDGSQIGGVRGGATHIHDYGYGLGHIKIEQTGERIDIPLNRMNIPDWSK